MYRCEGYNIGHIMPSSTISALNGPTGFVGEAQNKFDQPTTVRAALLASGIVYGYLGTSPLDTLQTIIHIMGDQFTPEAALGSLSLIFWSLIVTISVKSCLFVIRSLASYFTRKFSAASRPLLSTISNST